MNIPRAKQLLLFLVVIFWVSHVSVNGQNALSSESLLKQSIALTLTQPDSSIQLVTSAINQAKQDEDEIILMQCYRQLGYIHYNLNNFDEAEKYFFKSAEIALKVGEQPGLALAYNRLGNVLQLKSSYLHALEYYDKALAINKKLDSKPEIARTLVNLANTYSVVGQYQRSIEYFLEALNIHEESGDRDGMAWASLGIARLFKKLDLLDRAMQYAENSLRFYQEIEIESGISVGVTLALSEIGSLHHRIGNFEQAMEYTAKVLEINKQNGNLHGQSGNYLNLGIIYFDMKQHDAAKENLLKALELKNRLGDSIDIAPLYRYLGSVEMEEGRIASAHQFFNKSLEFATQHRLLPEICEAYLSLSNVHTKLGNHQKALEVYMNHSTYRDSLNSSEISKLEMQHEFEKREREQEQREALQQAKLERQRVVLVFFVVAFLLAGALAGFIFYNYKEKQRINQVLIKQNEEISRQNREIELQKEEIEQQRDFVTKQRDQIVNQQQQITDSITYASRIQSAVLPGESMLKSLPWESFVFYSPKNIVSGDFYWVTKLADGNVLLVAADCTGHGVPGAFMSMLGIALLREISSKAQVLTPAQMLSHLREMVLVSLNQDQGEVNQADGMDMAVAVINPETLVMNYAGAYLPVILVRQGEFDSHAEHSAHLKFFSGDGVNLLEIKGDKMPIGHHIVEAQPFTEISIQLHQGDMLYLFSDGYADQFGGENNIKFLMQNFRNMLMEIYQLPLPQQKKVVETTIEKYKGNQKQVDDMLVMGVRVV